MVGTVYPCCLLYLTVASSAKMIEELCGQVFIGDSFERLIDDERLDASSFEIWGYFFCGTILVLSHVFVVFGISIVLFDSSALKFSVLRKLQS